MPALSFVLLKAPVPIDAKAITVAFGELFPKEAPLVAAPVDGAVVTLKSGEFTTMVALVEAPVPKGEADEAASRSLGSLAKGGFTVPPHLAHLIVTTIGEEMKTVPGLTRHTRVVASIAQAMKAVAVYEGSAGATHEPSFYIEVASGTSVPAMLWNGLSVVRTEDRLELLSLGMSQLDLPDLLLVAPRSRSSQTLEFFFDLLSYVATRGERVPEGETVGRTADEKLAVRYVPSPLDENVEIARISMVD